MIFWTVVTISIIFCLPSHAAPRHRQNADNVAPKNFVQLAGNKMYNLEKSLSEKFDEGIDTEGHQFLQQNSQETSILKRKRYSDHLHRKRGAYDLNGPSEKRALMEYYASMLVTSADQTYRPILKEKLGEALEMKWTDFDSFKNYCDELVDEITSYDFVVLDDDFNLTDHLYTIIKK